MDNSNSYTVGVVYPNGTANDSNTTPHSFDIVINTPQHIKSMAELDLELDANGSAITLSATSATDDYEQRIQLPLRIDESSITAKYKKKRNMLMIAATILTEDQGQPRELLDNVRTARRQLMGLTTTSEQTKPAAAAPMASAPPPAPAASSATAQALYDKYKSVKEGSGEVDTPPPAPVATPTTAPSPEPVVAVSIPPTTSPPTPTIGQYTNSKVNVLDHPTDRLQLISPPALVDVVCTCLSIAQRQPSPSDPITIKSIMESFPSKSQSELCRQLLIQAVKFAVQTNPTSPPTLPKQVKERFVKLAEHQMKKIEEGETERERSEGREERSELPDYGIYNTLTLPHSSFRSSPQPPFVILFAHPSPGEEAGEDRRPRQAGPGARRVISEAKREQERREAFHSRPRTRV